MLSKHCLNYLNKYLNIVLIFVLLAKKVITMNILRLKEVLAERGVSGKDLASKVGMTPTTISNIIQGNNFPKPETLVAIASALDVDVKDLFIPTKERPEEREGLFVKRDGEFIKIGEIDLSYPIVYINPGPK